jgi:hypothetical protein
VKPPAAPAHADVALGAQRLERALRQGRGGGHGAELQQVRAVFGGVVLRERRELAEQPLGGRGVPGPG